jgi:hypothetical protein
VITKDTLVSVNDCVRCIAAFDKSKSKEEIEDYVKLGFAVPDFKELKSNMLIDRDKFLMVSLSSLLSL